MTLADFIRDYGDLLTPIEQWALSEVLEGIRQVAAGGGYGNVTLFLRPGGGERAEVTIARKRPA